MDDNRKDTILNRCKMPEATGIDAIESRLVFVQEVPPKMELHFYAVRGTDRERMTPAAVSALFREHFVKPLPNAMTQVELWVEIEALRAEVARMEPVYEAAKKWRTSRGSRDRRAMADAMLEVAVDFAIAKETTSR